MAEGEHFLGHDGASRRMPANLVQEWTLDPREPGFAHALEQGMTAPALHDGPELSHSEETVTVMSRMGAAESGDAAGSSVSCLPRHGNERTTRNRNVRSTQNYPRWSAELDSRNRWVTARRNGH